ncbi:SseB family protein [Nocardioides sp.]|uniref:SseB family protein n=1 Tax=Nocardioides sp. TaxID=35761 RepID=UPI0027362C73|nr:SseB family protein [Nocardioides sp.]MDP3892214.1 SseB family protein [Nocardioides sp.]
MSQPGPSRFAGSRIPDSGFARDTGEQDAAVAAALEEYALDRSRYADVLLALRESRVLVPVVAVLGEVEYDDQGLAHDKSSDMAAVLMQGRDGRLALLAFTGTTTLQAWNPEARPVPVTAQVAAQSAVQDEAVALVLDIAGPVPVVVEGEDLRGLAAGWALARVGDQVAWIRPDRA